MRAGRVRTLGAATEPPRAGSEPALPSTDWSANAQSRYVRVTDNAAVGGVGTFTGGVARTSATLISGLRRVERVLEAVAFANVNRRRLNGDRTQPEHRSH